MPVEIWKTLIERLLSWPVALFIVAMVFRKPITELMNELVEFVVTKEGVSFKKKKELLAQKDTEPVEKGLGDGEPQTALVHGGPQADPEFLRRVEDYGKGSVAAAQRAEAVRKDLQILPYDDKKKVEILSQHLGVMQTLLAAEKIYRLIFQSQIELLRQINMYGSKPLSDLQKFYERVHPKLSTFYKFPDYLDFMVAHELLEEEGDGRYGITMQGKEFLSWLAVNGLPDKPKFE